MKILIVDDDYTYRKLLASILISQEHDIAEAENGAIAWEILQETHYPFIITDWMMPVLNGPMLVQKIREANFPNYTYIIMLTARDAREDIVDGLDSGADDYLTKPFDLDELRARVAIGRRIIDLETRLKILATCDSLTNLLNRRALYEATRAEWDRTYREKQPISILMLDLDHFKEINDQYGHMIGDQALRHIANLIIQHKRSYDLVGRWGGEEFIIVLPNTDLCEAEHVAERLRTAFNSTPLELTDEQTLTVRASFGIAGTTPTNNSDFDRCIQQADRALYRSKNTGRDQVCIYGDEDERRD